MEKIHNRLVYFAPSGIRFFIEMSSPALAGRASMCRPFRAETYWQKARENRPYCKKENGNSVSLLFLFQKHSYH